MLDVQHEFTTGSLFFFANGTGSKIATPMSSLPVGLLKQYAAATLLNCPRSWIVAEGKEQVEQQHLDLLLPSAGCCLYIEVV